MSYAVCCVPVAPLRMQPDHKVEMVSQLLFGEYCTIIDTGSNGWVHIVCKADNYSGWCQLAQVQKISDVVYNNPDQVLAAGWINELDYNEQVMMVPFGSSLTAIKNGKIVWGKNEIEFDGEKNRNELKHLSFWKFRDSCDYTEIIKKFSFCDF